MKTNKPFYVVGFIFIILGVALLIFISSTKLLGWKEAPIVRVVDTGVSCTRTSITNSYDYYYQVSGKTYRTSDCGNSKKTIMYLPSHPNVAFLEGINAYHKASALIVLLGLGLVGFAVYLDRKKLNDPRTPSKIKRKSSSGA